MRQDPPLPRSNRRHKILPVLRNDHRFRQDQRFRNKSTYTTINSHSSQTAQSASDTLKVAPTNEAEESLDPSVSPQTNSISPTLPPLLTPSCNGSKIVSTRGWSGALPQENQSFWRMFEELYAKCNVQKEIKKLLMIFLYLFHLVFYRRLLI